MEVLGQEEQELHQRLSALSWQALQDTELLSSLGAPGTRPQAEDVRGRINQAQSNFRQCLRALKGLGEEQDTPQATEQLQKLIHEHQMQYERLKAALQESYNKMKRNARESFTQNQQELFSGAGNPNVRIQSQQQAVKASQGVTESLRRTHQQMTEQIKLTDGNLEVMGTSTGDLSNAKEELQSQKQKFVKSRKLLNTMETHDIWDKVVLWGGILLFSIVAFYVFQDRVLGMTPDFVKSSVSQAASYSFSTVYSLGLKFLKSNSTIGAATTPPVAVDDSQNEPDAPPETGQEEETGAFPDSGSGGCTRGDGPCSSDGDTAQQNVQNSADTQDTAGSDEEGEDGAFPDPGSGSCTGDGGDGSCSADGGTAEQYVQDSGDSGSNEEDQTETIPDPGTGTCAGDGGDGTCSSDPARQHVEDSVDGGDSVQDDQTETTADPGAGICTGDNDGSCSSDGDAVVPDIQKPPDNIREKLERLEKLREAEMGSDESDDGSDSSSEDVESDADPQQVEVPAQPAEGESGSKNVEGREGVQDEHEDTAPENQPPPVKSADGQDPAGTTPQEAEPVDNAEKENESSGGASDRDSAVENDDISPESKVAQDIANGDLEMLHMLPDDSYPEAFDIGDEHVGSDAPDISSSGSSVPEADPGSAPPPPPEHQMDDEDPDEDEYADEEEDEDEDADLETDGMDSTKDDKDEGSASGSESDMADEGAAQGTVEEEDEHETENDSENDKESGEDEDAQEDDLDDEYE